MSDDEKELTVRTVRVGPPELEETARFDRIAGGSGLIGVWQAREMRGDEGFIEFTSTDGEQVTIGHQT